MNGLFALQMAGFSATGGGGGGGGAGGGGGGGGAFISRYARSHLFTLSESTWLSFRKPMAMPHATLASEAQVKTLLSALTTSGASVFASASLYRLSTSLRMSSLD